ncbi:DUF6878 family protein [Acidisoma silvae]|uniref:DUF6878 domain-containing protein n=1 Tax=Acidisoma silvae TaxID=2802396 RepID=A0A964E161_9PROT|nr:DUF6878 family protein [Acidisoma silvae]MCB8877874.1 hypothetical protein [Acidisoma silvae]
MQDNQLSIIEANHARFDRLSAELLPLNKQAIFDALAAAGIEYVEVEFDGYGDEGSFQGIVAYKRDNQTVELPTCEIKLKTVNFATGSIEVKITTPGDATETMVSDFLEETHSGWEDGEGAFGQFTLTLADRSITLDYNERFIDSTHHDHAF